MMKKKFSQWVAEQHIKSAIFHYHYWKVRGETLRALGCLRSALVWRTITPLKCEVIDAKGNHCPNFPTRELLFNGERVKLCEACYKNVLDGAYGGTVERL